MAENCVWRSFLPAASLTKQTPKVRSNFTEKFDAANCTDSMVDEPG